ncbi:hypothetical protein Q4E93_10055 [Flavitalea sp. BT771]|uniref:hypothetical protein n=1 Tax=Flavitalea sp. BT771 TaxID=3063329 RepID=UPI0026E3C426|nr:hypothetical protein [Flavitalea sp. BT771]MDO6430931.1 hypothetical protein [Flavitalea sp. BT771]MDV6218929.1 hypothetical protein [Flavitalea sp. BT771]
MMRSRFKSDTTDRIIAKLSSLLPWSFYLNIDFNKVKSFKKSELENCITQIASYCAIEFKDLENMERRDVQNLEFNINDPEHSDTRAYLIEQGFRNLPSGVDSITITRWDGLSYSWNTQTEGGVIPNLTIDHLGKSLQDKDKKLEKFQKCDEHWLLITSGDYYYGAFDRINLTIPVISKFDKVFFFRLDRGEVFVLK